MIIVIGNVKFKNVSDTFAEKVVQRLLIEHPHAKVHVSKSPSINKPEAMTEDLTPEQLEVLDLLGERINSGTLKTAQPKSLSEIVRNVIRAHASKEEKVISYRNILDDVTRIYTEQGGKSSKASIQSVVGNVGNRIGARSIAYGTWKIPSINELPEE